MLDVYQYFKKMRDESIILYFKGEITNNLLTSILQLIDDKLERKSEAIKTKRKVFSILLECLQNVYNYYQEKEFDNERYHSAILMIKKTDNAYHIVTGNYMSNTEVPQLQKKLDKVNSLSPVELKAFYKEVLNEEEFTGSGGAGLGIIDMARKSGQKIDYSFDAVSDNHCFYSLQVKVLA